MLRSSGTVGRHFGEMKGMDWVRLLLGLKEFDPNGPRLRGYG